MSDIEKGRRYPPDKKLDDIARILKLEGTNKENYLTWQLLHRSILCRLTCLNIIMDKDPRTRRTAELKPVTFLTKAGKK